MKLTIFLLVAMYCMHPSQIGADYIEKICSHYSGSGIVLVIPATGADGSCEMIAPRDAVYQYFKKNESTRYSKFSDFMKSVFFRKSVYDLRKCPKNKFIKIDKDTRIIKEYRSKGINYIIKTYLDTNGGRLYSKSMDNKNSHGLVGIMFENEYFVYFSDYSGKYLFSKSIL